MFSITGGKFQGNLRTRELVGTDVVTEVIKHILRISELQGAENEKLP